MKSYEAFCASVYAKAEAKQTQIKARNRRIRNVSVSALCALVIAVAAVPLSRLYQPAEIVPQPTTEESGMYHDTHLGQTSAPRMVLLSSDANAVVLVDQEAKQAFVSEFRQANNLCEYQGLPVIPAFESAVSIQTAEELAEFIAELPQDLEALQDIIGDYDEEFFAGYDLYTMPMGIGMPTEINFRPLLSSIEQPNEQQPTQPHQNCDCVCEHYGTGEDCECLPEHFCACVEDAPELCSAEATPEQACGELANARVTLLLLVPMNK